MRPASVLGVLVLLGLAGGVAWYVVGREPMGPVTEDPVEATGPSLGGPTAPPTEPETVRPVPSGEGSPSLPREALFSAAETLPRETPEGEIALVRVEEDTVTRGQVRGGVLLDAILATGKVYVRYANESARSRVRSGLVPVSTAVTAPEGGPGGVPLPIAVNLLAMTGTEVVLRYPVVFVGGIPGESSPR